MTHLVLHDCDPGLDDALAIALAAGDPDLELVAITTVGGNVSLDLTTDNARRIREYLHLDSVPIGVGAPGPLLGPTRDAAEVHGETGLGNSQLPEATLAVDPRTAVDLIIETVRAQSGMVHLVATGPMTNIALALQRDPELVSLVASFTIMGGSYTRGNATPAAEFNIYADPEAARIVFAAGWTVTMIGLDITERAVAGPTVLERLRPLGALADEYLLPMATYWAELVGSDSQAVHDVCAMAFVARPDLFTLRPARVDIETEGRYTTGMTVVDFDSPTTNSLVAVELDVPAFWDYVIEAYGRAAALRR